MSNKKAPLRSKPVRYLVADTQDSHAAVFSAGSAEEAAKIWFMEMTDGGDSPTSVTLECYVVPLDSAHKYRASIDIRIEKVEKK